MKKAIKIFAVILILSAISTICFLAAAGTELIEYIIDYASRHRIESFGEFDDFDNVLKDYVIEKYGEITNSDGENLFRPEKEEPPVNGERPGEPPIDISPEMSDNITDEAQRDKQREIPSEFFDDITEQVTEPVSE